MIIKNSQILYDYLMSFIGIRYKWGGSNPLSGFDCSGFVTHVLCAFGLLPWKCDYSAQGLYYQFKMCIQMTPMLGSLLFFGPSTGHITHVGIAINDKIMIEASGGDSQVRDLDEADQKDAFIKLSPIAHRKDLVAICHPHYPWEAGT